ncbi:MAG: hypothetical protein ACXWP5_02455 [Bdellovibrionota bacterium]
MSALSDYMAQGPVGIDQTLMVFQIYLGAILEYGPALFGGAVAILLAYRGHRRFLESCAGEAALAYREEPSLVPGSRRRGRDEVDEDIDRLAG